MPAMQSRDFKREETLTCRGWLGRCAGDAGVVVQSPLAAMTAPTSGEQRHQMGARTRALRPPAAATGGATPAAHELFVCSDGRGNPSSREAAAPAARRRTSPRPQPAATGGRTRGLGLRLKQTKSN